MGPDRVVETLTTLVDTVTDSFDVVDFANLLVARSLELPDIDAAGLLLTTSDGELALIAASSEQIRLLELFQLRDEEGPCLDAFRTGSRISHADLARAAGRWPRFATAASKAKFGAVESLPMRLRDDVIGALNLFRATPGELPEQTVRTAQALVNAATIGLLHERAIRHHSALAEQLQNALTSRVAIEQAKGLVAGRVAVELDGALTILRGYVRHHNQKLNQVAEAVIAGRIGISELIGAP